MKKLIVWLFVFALFAGVTWWALDLRQRSEEMAKAVEELRRRLMQTITTTWVSGGATYTVTTTRKEDEDLDAFNARHDAAVAAAMKLHPKD